MKPVTGHADGDQAAAHNSGELARPVMALLRRVGASSMWSLSGEERTWRGSLETDAIDPQQTSPPAGSQTLAAVQAKRLKAILAACLISTIDTSPAETFRSGR
jgi:hypothetical protein